eukprot:2304769-Pleurochrysis_carterae.AAC.2
MTAAVAAAHTAAEARGGGKGRGRGGVSSTVLGTNGDNCFVARCCADADAPAKVLSTHGMCEQAHRCEHGTKSAARAKAHAEKMDMVMDLVKTHIPTSGERREQRREALTARRSVNSGERH